MTLRIEDVHYPISFNSLNVGIITFSDAKTGVWDNGALSPSTVLDYVQQHNRYYGLTGDYAYTMPEHSSEDKCMYDSKPVDAIGLGMKYDGDKPRMDLLIDGCPNALEAVAQVLTFGAKKYAAHSWHTVPEGEARYKAALLRHLVAHGKGEVNDEESGLLHLAHAACDALFILELEMQRLAKSE